MLSPLAEALPLGPVDVAEIKTLRRHRSIKMAFTDFIINMRYFRTYYKIKLYLEMICVVTIFVLYFCYVFFRLGTSMYAWLII